MKLSADMQRVVREQRLGFVATVTPDGRPNLSPKGTTGLWDDERLFFADIASPGTVANLRANPHVEVNVVDSILRKGFRFKGTAIVYTSGERYDRGLEILRKQGSTATRERVRSIVVIEVTEAGELTSPAYDDGGTARAAHPACHRKRNKKTPKKNHRAGDLRALARLLHRTPPRLEAARELNAVIADLFDRGRQQAAALDASGVLRNAGSGPLAGVPFLLKDLGASLAGAHEAMGSRALRTHVATESAWIVDRYLAAGLVMFGKTNTPE